MVTLLIIPNGGVAGHGAGGGWPDRNDPVATWTD
jgi:hypothetical protein